MNPTRAWGRGYGVALALAVAISTSAGAPGTARAAGKGATGGKAAAGARSDERAQAKAEVEKAQVDYKLGRFQEALDGYRRAYELYQAPLLLFDMGQCHRNLGDPEKAIFFFEGYLREETRPDSEHRRLAEQLIAESRADLQRKMAVAAVAAPPAPAPAPQPVHLRAMDMQGVVPTSLVARPADRDQPAPAAHRSIASRWWFWTAIAGACAVAAGAAVYYATGEPRTVPPHGTLGTIDAQTSTTSP
jgi:tetratricopeptide (TPR) repeat protein